MSRSARPDGVSGIKDTATPERATHDDASRPPATRRAILNASSASTPATSRSRSRPRAGRPCSPSRRAPGARCPAWSTPGHRATLVEPFELVEPATASVNSRRWSRPRSTGRRADHHRRRQRRHPGELCPALAHHDLVPRARLSPVEGCRVAHADTSTWKVPARYSTPRPLFPDLPLSDVRVLVVSSPQPRQDGGSRRSASARWCPNAGCVPADVARLPVFTDILADIGDDQSIAQSPRPSVHVRRLVHIHAGGTASCCSRGLEGPTDEAAARAGPPNGCHRWRDGPRDHPSRRPEGGPPPRRRRPTRQSIDTPRSSPPNTIMARPVPPRAGHRRARPDPHVVAAARAAMRPAADTR